MSTPSCKAVVPTLDCESFGAQSSPCSAPHSRDSETADQASPPPGYCSWHEVTVHARQVANWRGLHGNDADDVVQTTIFKLLHSYWSRAKCQWSILAHDAHGLVARIATNCALSAHRARKRDQAVTSVDWIDQLQDREGYGYVCSVANIFDEAELTDKQQYLMHGSILANSRRSYQQLGQELNISVGAVRGQINRAKRKLKNYLLH